jgi:hypothetical protein
MPIRLIELVIHHLVIPIRLQTFRQLPLLFDREERVGLNAYDEGRVVLFCETDGEGGEVGVEGREGGDKGSFLADDLLPLLRVLRDPARWCFRVGHASIALVSACLEVIEGILRHGEEVHGFGDVDEGVGVVFEAEGFALMVEVRLDEEVGAEDGGRGEGGGGGGEVAATASESLFPLWTRSVRDRGNFCGQGVSRKKKLEERERTTSQLHASVRWEVVVVESSLPIWIRHQHCSSCQSCVSKRNR